MSRAARFNVGLLQSPSRHSAPPVWIPIRTRMRVVQFIAPDRTRLQVRVAVERCQPTGYGHHDLTRQLRRFRKEAGELTAVQHLDHHIGPGRHRGRTRSVVKEGDLTDEVARPSNRDDFAVTDNLHLALKQNQELASDLTLAGKDLAGLEIERRHETRHLRELPFRQPFEQRYACKPLVGRLLPGHPRLLAGTSLSGVDTLWRCPHRGAPFHTRSGLSACSLRAGEVNRVMGPCTCSLSRSASHRMTLSKRIGPRPGLSTDGRRFRLRSIETAQIAGSAPVRRPGSRVWRCSVRVQAVSRWVVPSLCLSMTR